MHAAQRAILIERGFMSSERIAAFSNHVWILSAAL